MESSTDNSINKTDASSSERVLSTTTAPTIWTVGQLVQVESRTWPGINQPGGVGRITGVSKTTTATANTDAAQSQPRVSVKYVLDGRHEKEIAVQYVTAHHLHSQTQHQFRDRRMLLGRCSHCGSLRTDCGSCDVWVVNDVSHPTVARRPSRKRRPAIAKSNGKSTLEQVVECAFSSEDEHNGDSNNNKGSSSDDDDSVDLEALAVRYKKEFRKYKRMQARAREMYKTANLYNFSSESDDDSNIKKKPVTEKSKRRPPERGNKRSLSKKSDGSDSHRASSGSDDDKQYTRLNELACSQVLLSPAISRRKGRSWYTTEQSSRNKMRLKMIRRGRRAIVESSSSDDDVFSDCEEQQEPKSPACLRELPVSNPGSPDCSSEHEASTTQQQSMAPTSLGPLDKAYSSDTNNVNFPDNDDNVQQDDDAVVMDDDPFIQPEGDANDLPGDIADSTAGLEYPELDSFFDEMAQRLESRDAPALRDSVLDLERRWNMFKAASTSKNPNESRQALLDLSNDLYDSLIEKLVRRGVDQCQRALRKLVSKRFYRQYKADAMLRRAIVAPFREQDRREFKLDAISEAVEDLRSKIRMIQESMEDFEDSESGASNNSDGWAEPLSQSPSQHCQGYFSSASQSFLQLENDEANAFEAHPYANKKRKARAKPQTKGRARARRRSGHDPCWHGSKRRKDNRKRAVPTGKLRSPSLNKTYNLNIGSGEALNIPHESDDDSVILSSDESDDMVQEIHKKSSRKAPNKGGGADDDSVILSSESDDKVQEIHKKSSRKAPNKGGGAEIPSYDEPEKKKSGNNFRLRKNSRHSKQTYGFNELNSYGVGRETIAHRGNSTLSIPDIENILPRNMVSRREMVRNTSARVAIGDRMNRWLSANAENDTGSSFGDSTGLDATSMYRPLDEGIRPTREKSTGRKRQAKSNRSDSRGNSYSVAATSEWATHSASTISNRDGSYVDFVQLINDVMTGWNDAQIQVKRERSHCAFQKLLKTIQRRNLPLQAYVSCAVSDLDVVVGTLSSIIRLIDLGVNEVLDESDAKLFSLFGKDQCHDFINLVLLQLVDSAMSLAHPMAWSVPVECSGTVLRRLEPLRNELAKHFHLPEKACRILSRELNLQEWRVVDNGKIVYVSAVDPAWWQSLLSGETICIPNAESRLSSFTNCLPRCEVDALWRVLDFFCTVDGSRESIGFFRYDFIASMLTKGSISLCSTQSDSTINEPPCKEQVAAAAEDIANFASLVLEKSLEAIPRRDRVLFEVMLKCVNLQSDDLFYNEETRIACYPTTSDWSNEKKVFDRVIDGTIKCQDYIVHSSHDFVKRICSNNGAMLSMRQPLLLPSSRLLQCCIGLLIAWAEKVPHNNRSRRQSFILGIKSFVKQLACQNEKNQGTNKSGNHAPPKTDRFSDAFSSPCNILDKGGKPEEIRSIFLCESAAYMTICSSLVLMYKSEQDSNSSDLQSLCHQVWGLLSDDSMRQRQLWVAANNESPRQGSKFERDGMQLYVAAKAISFLALSILRESSEESDRTESVIFLVSCVLACLDCSCDTLQRTELSACISGCLAVVIGTLLSIHGNGVLLSRFPVLSTSAILKQIFLRITCASFCDVEEDVCFQNVVTLARQITVVSMKAGQMASGATITETAAGADEFDVLFDGINDVALEGVIFGKEPSNNVSLLSILDLFVNALDKARPSLRYSISSDDSSFSAQGIKLIHKRSDIMCRCIADIVAIQWQSGWQTKKKLWILQHRFTKSRNDGDAKHAKILALFLTRQLCHLHESPGVTEAFQDSEESFLFNLIESLLDTKVMRKIPSCNLNRIEAVSGSKGLEKGFTELWSYEKGSPTRLCAVVRDLRDYCGDIAILVRNVKERSYRHNVLAKKLSEFQQLADIDRVNSLLGPSIEKESIDRFVLFRDILFKTTSSSSLSLFVERCAALLIASLSFELGKLLELKGIQDQAHHEMQEQSYIQAKLSETISCYSEMYASVIATIFCLVGRSHSEKLFGLILHISKNLIVPLLKQEDLDIVHCLSAIVTKATDVLSGDGQLTHAAEPQRKQIRMMGLTSDCPNIRLSLLRRRREFVLTFATGPSKMQRLMETGLLDALVLAGIKDSRATFGVSQAFCSYFYSRIPETDPDTDTGMTQSPLYNAIDLVFARSEAMRSRETTTMLRSFRHQMLEKAVFPKISTGRFVHDIKAKTGALLLAKHMLDTEQIDTRLNDHKCKLEPLSLCTLSKGIGACVRTALTQSSQVDEELLMASFSCARSVLNIPASCIEDGSIGWLIDWAYSSRSLQHGVSYITSLQLQARYLWFFSAWMNDIAELLTDIDNAGTVQCVRQRFRDNEEKVENDKSLWPSAHPTCDDNCRNISDLDRELFPVVKHGSIKIVNVYAPSRNSTNKDTLELWSPSYVVRSTLSKFSTKVQSTLPALGNEHESKQVL